MDRICIAAIIVAMLICILFMNGEALGLQASAKVMGYENRLFDNTKVHTIDIVIDDWDSFLSTAQSEEYAVCSVVIDAEPIKNVGIRGKGNTSLSNVASMNSDRYSFKIEFDQYDSTKSYYGLDKLSLNNLIQDNTMMKDFLTYTMMAEFGVDAPLCSFVYITVNGEDWGLYLAVEGVEEAFLQRNYGSNYGDLYKPDSMNMGGGRGNGKDFDFEDFTVSSGEEDFSQIGGMMPGRDSQQSGQRPDNSGSFGISIDEETLRDIFTELGIDTALLDGVDFDNITTEAIQTILSSLDQETMQKLMEKLMGDVSFENMGDFGGMGMGSSGTKLQYVDDDPDSYSTIFDSAKTDVTDADQARLIASLKQLSAYENLEEVLDIDQVLRYFVVHNFVVNDDSYTGSMIHNYYLYEENGRLAMIPWDYNLAFGTFQSGSASSAVNDAIDTVLSDRPMQAWIFSNEYYAQQYYALYAEMLETVDIQGIIDDAYSLIAPYVQKDPTAFCSYEEFESGVAALKQFCNLRTQSVQLQLSGSEETVDTGDLNLSDMGTMMSSMGGFDMGDMTIPGINTDQKEKNNQTQGGVTMPEGMEGMPMPGSGEMPEGMEGITFPEGMEGMEGMQGMQGMPSGGNISSGGVTSISADMSSVILLLVSLAVLAFGMIFVAKFKRRN